jgi:SAM-dependent methyltransferase
MPAATYHDIVAHYESCLARFGDECRGVDWPNAADAEKRYRVMLELIREPAGMPASLLDFGCGLAHFYEYLLRVERAGIDYTGLDLSPEFVAACRSKFPGVPFLQADVLDGSSPLETFDYIVLNGVLTGKRSLPFEEMWSYTRQLLAKLYGATRKGLAFNVMSKQVDWERTDLFHLPLDEVAEFLTQTVSRNFVIRNDYGLYEYTVYVYR